VIFLLFIIISYAHALILSLDALKFPSGKVNVLYTVKKYVLLPGEAGQVEYSEVRLQVTARVRDVDGRLLQTKVVFTISVQISLKPFVIAFQFPSDKSLYLKL
jgi:hypothetical protein